MTKAESAAKKIAENYRTTRNLERLIIEVSLQAARYGQYNVSRTMFNDCLVNELRKIEDVNPKVVITVDDGNVQIVFSDKPIDVRVIDYAVEGAGCEDEIIKVIDSDGEEVGDAIFFNPGNSVDLWVNDFFEKKKGEA